MTASEMTAIARQMGQSMSEATDKIITDVLLSMTPEELAEASKPRKKIPARRARNRWVWRGGSGRELGRWKTWAEVEAVQDQILASVGPDAYAGEIKWHGPGAPTFNPVKQWASIADIKGPR